MTMQLSERYIGIDYPGAQTPTSSLKGLRVYMADWKSKPVEVQPPPSPRKYWTRRGVAEWLAERLAEDLTTLVGIDHGFSFPLRYFEVHHLPPQWPAFLFDKSVVIHPCVSRCLWKKAGTLLVVAGRVGPVSTLFH